MFVHSASRRCDEQYIWQTPNDLHTSMLQCGLHEAWGELRSLEALQTSSWVGTAMLVSAVSPSRGPTGPCATTCVVTLLSAGVPLFLNHGKVRYFRTESH